MFLPEKDKGDEHLSALELGNLPQFFALEQLLRPAALATSSFDALAQAIGAIAGIGMREPPRAAAPEEEAAATMTELREMKEQIAAMREGLADQAAKLGRLEAVGAAGPRRRSRKEK